MFSWFITDQESSRRVAVFLYPHRLSSLLVVVSPDFGDVLGEKVLVKRGIWPNSELKYIDGEVLGNEED